MCSIMIRLEEKIADMDDFDDGGVEEKVGLWGREIKWDVEERKDKDEDEEAEESSMKDAVAQGWEAAFAAAGLRSSVE